jgi:hypothetical protein
MLSFSINLLYPTNFREEPFLLGDDICFLMIYILQTFPKRRKNVKKRFLCRKSGFFEELHKLRCKNNEELHKSCYFNFEELHILRGCECISREKPMRNC